MADDNEGAGGLEAEALARALKELSRLLDARRIDAQQPLGPATVYTTHVTIWLLIYQRLYAGASLSDAVHELLDTDAKQLPANRRVRERTLSANSGAYSRARTRLRPEITKGLADHIFASLLAATPSSLGERRGYYLDGTTIALAPEPELREAFPPAPNQYGDGVWPIAHLLVAHEIDSGCAPLPEIGAKFGPNAVSEQQLACRLVRRLPAGSLVVADANFGVFSVAFAASQAKHDGLLRFTPARFKALRRAAQPAPDGDASSERYHLRWQPSKKDRQTNPELPEDAALDVWLHDCGDCLPGGKRLLLATSWDCTSEEAKRLYRRRYDVETDIRDVKVALKTEQLTARSAAMLRKELAASFIAYNLVIQVRRLAAQRAGVPPRRISFARTWSAVRVILLAPQHWSASKWLEKFELTLRAASQHKIPHRPGRSYPRKAHPRRNKSTSGKKTAPNPNQQPPPTK